MGAAEMLIAPMMMSYLMSSVAPLTMMMSAGGMDRDLLARGLAQMTIVSMRSAMEVTYEDIHFDERTSDFSLRGIELTLPEAAGVPGCKIGIEALTIVSLDRSDALSVSTEADGVSVAPACAAEQGPMLLALLGKDALDLRHFASTSVYHLGQSSLDHSMILETASAGSVSANVRLERLHLEMDESGEPTPAGEIVGVEITLQETDALKGLLPILGLEQNPVDTATGALGGFLSQGGLSEPEKALIDSADAELKRVLEQGGGVTLRSGAGASATFAELATTTGPQDLVPLLRPVFSASLPGADDLITSDTLATALSDTGAMSPDDLRRVAEALATGEGAPRSVSKALDLLNAAAEKGDPAAMLRYATLLNDEGGDAKAAYRYALRAGAEGAAGVRSALDRIEGDLPLQEVLELQNEVVGELPDPQADIATLRDNARRFAHGRGVVRHYGQALLLASLAAAGGDRSSSLLQERLTARFADTDDADAWRKLESAQAERALALWSEGFGDGFATAR